ncbi:hypothetical protein RA210_U10023 [Rubrivivax sp. A210]|nr:hypothetical protein RA210_U10023 [Rubrivivax sp. A210]
MAVRVAPDYGASPAAFSPRKGNVWCSRFRACCRKPQSVDNVVGKRAAFALVPSLWQVADVMHSHSAFIFFMQINYLHHRVGAVTASMRGRGPDGAAVEFQCRANRGLSRD